MARAPTSSWTRTGEPRVVTVREAAKVLGVSKDALYDAIARGEIRGVVRVGRRILLNLDILLAGEQS